MDARSFKPWLMLPLLAVGLALGGPSQAATLYFAHTDAQGSVVAVTDIQRNVVDRREYEPYGLPRQPIADDPSYTGHVHDADSGLVYMQQRYYDAETGRFLSVDPVGVSNAGGNFNRYWYANNNPYTFVDPDGMFIRDPNCNGGQPYCGRPRDGDPIERMQDDHCRRTCVSGGGDARSSSGERGNSYWADVLFGRVESVVDGVTSAADSAVDHWVQSGNPLMGTLAMTMTPDHAADTALSLLGSGTLLSGVRILATKSVSLASNLEITATGSRIANIWVSNLSGRQFVANLVSNGYQVVRTTVGANGSVTVLSQGSKTYSLYTSTSTGALSAQVIQSGVTASKIRILAGW